MDIANKNQVYLLIRILLLADSDDSKSNKKSSNLKVDRLRTDMMGTVEDTKHPDDIELDALTLVLGYREKRWIAKYIDNKNGLMNISLS